ncbi:unnamed protein product [Orchesella dallaii]|uniref:Proton-coupled zinc antiporter SLC30A5 n=1 Tax=Orchesella dallaii TaxID=48710 RepID=A0ABP1R7R6_9HEXA
MLGTSPIGSSDNASNDMAPKYPRGRLNNKSKIPWLYGLLICCKSFSALSSFFLFDFLRRNGEHSPATGVIFGNWSLLIQTLSVVQILSGIISIVVQKPFSNWNNTKLSKKEWIRIFRHAVISIILMLVWMSGLQLCGPFRTVIIAAHYNFVLAGILSGFFISKTGAKLRGGVLFATGILIMLLFDNGDTSRENIPRGQPTKSPDSDVEQSFLSASSVGILILVLCLFYKMGFEAFAKNLAVDLGGSKRLHALSTLTSGVILLMMYFVDLMSGADMIPFWSNVFTLTFITIFGFVLDYYMDSICLKRLEPAKVARVGTTSSMFAGIIYAMLWTTEETPSTSTLLAFLLIYLGVLSLTSMEKASGGGSFVGYSSDGLPLFSFSNHFSPETYVPMWKNVLKSTSSILKQIQDDAISRRLFYFSLLTMVFTGIEFLYGTLTNSLGLISDGFHMLFDSMALCIGLSASVICRWKPSKTYPFGYGRIEVLSGFLNSFFLLVIASMIMIEALQRLHDPPGVDAKRLLPISLIGLFVNLIGIYTFRSNSVISHGHSNGHNVNVKGVFLHILADLMGSIGVITSSLLIHNYGLLVADPICSMIIATLIVVSVLPLLKETSKMLLLAVPSGLEKNLQQTVLQILTTEGVKGYRNPRFWTHAPSVFTGSIHVQATEDANEQQVIRQVNNLFSSIGFTHFTTQLEKDEFIARKSFSTDYETQPSSESDIGAMQGNRLLLENNSLEGFGSETKFSSSSAVTQPGSDQEVKITLA